MKLYAGVDTDGRVKLFTMDSGIPRVVTHSKWLDVTHEIEGYAPGEMLLVELSREQPRLKVKDIIVHYPPWTMPVTRCPDPIRFRHPEVIIRIWGTLLDLRDILGIMIFDGQGEDIDPYSPRIFDVPALTPCPGHDEVLLDKLYDLGYLSLDQRERIECFIGADKET